ncbi:MAG TPA: UbiD family decarboxylase [Pseudonocardiaceae bacterium]|jgi:4-hydroxy-3-polyprenylbenzoate decarboxylase
MNPEGDLRSHLAALAELGELQRVDRTVATDLELGAIVRRCCEIGAPSPLFTSLDRGEPGFRVLGAPASTSSQPHHRLARIALALGLPPTAKGLDIVEALTAARQREPIPPRLVENGPCKQHVLLGNDVDLEIFPTPRIHDGDGGRYFNTWGALIVQDPEGHWTNWTISRLMIHDRRTLVGPLAPTQHIGQIFEQWRRLGQPMPFAVAQGGHPAIPFACAMPIPREVDEVAFLGAYLGAPLDVVTCETNVLQVPADAEIVIEGHVDPSRTGPEGPMGEYSGYIATHTWQAPLFHVDAITYRDEAILPVVAAGEPIDETHTASGTVYAAEALHQLRTAGLPVTTCWLPYEAATSWFVATVPAHWRDEFAGTSTDLVNQIASTYFHSKPGVELAVVIVTYDDVDPTDISALVWAMATRMHPHNGAIYFPDEPITPLPPSWSGADRAVMRATKVAYNCLYGDEYPDPADLPRRSSFRYCYPDSLQQDVLRNWESYGFSR